MSSDLNDFNRWIKINNLNINLPKSIEQLKDLSMLDLSKKN